MKQEGEDPNIDILVVSCVAVVYAVDDGISRILCAEEALCGRYAAHGDNCDGDPGL